VFPDQYQSWFKYLVNERSSEWIFVIQDFGPELHVSPSHQISSLRLEEGILVADGNQLAVALTALVSDASQVRVALLAITANNLTVVVRVFPKNTKFFYKQRIDILNRYLQ